MILTFNKLRETLSGANTILLISHRNPDPDTVGGALALGEYLASSGKNVTYFCSDRIPANFFYMPGSHDFISDKNITAKKYDLTIFIDCGEIARSGLPNLLETKQNLWIKIDHHLTAESFMDLEIRQPSSGATCEIIYGFLRHVNANITKTIATALLSGILIDTSFLSNAATSDESVRISGELVSYGADYRAVISAFHLNKDLKILKLWGNALSRLKHNKTNGIATTAIFKEDLIGEEAEEALSGLSGFLSGILQAKAVAVYFETPTGVRGSLRTTRDDINVADLAGVFGGGGHQKAAGFNFAGKIIEQENEWIVQ